MASSLHDRALTGICGWQDELCSQTMICGSVPEAMQRFWWQNHVFKYSVTWGSQRSQSSNIDFCLCPFSTAMSLNLLIIICTVDDGIFKFFANSTMKISLKLFQNLLAPFLQTGELLSIFATSLRCSFYTKSCYWPIANQPNQLQHVPPAG